MRPQVPSSVEHGGSVAQTMEPPTVHAHALPQDVHAGWDGPVCCRIARSCIFAQTRHRSELALTCGCITLIPKSLAFFLRT